MTAREHFLVYLMGFIGIPYIWGGSDPRKGLDCSGFIQIVLGKYKLDPPGDQTAHALMEHFLNGDNGSVIVGPGKLENVQLGDLIFYGRDRCTHITMALNRVLMVEAGGGGSSTTTVERARKIGACVRVANINRRSDIMCIIRPKGLPW